MRHIKKCPKCNCEMLFDKKTNTYSCGLCSIKEPADTNDDFARKLFEIVKNVKPCKPKKDDFFYNADGDLLEYWKEVPVIEDYYAKWISPFLTLMISRETEQVIGYQIEATTEFMKRVNKTIKTETTKKKKRDENERTKPRGSH